MTQYRALVAALHHPDVIHDTWGLYNKRSLSALNRNSVDLDVVVPRPYAPPVGPFSSYAKVPKVSDTGMYITHHPRFLYLLPKRFFYGVSGRSYANNVERYVEKEFESPDVVHGCHLYPDGYAMKELATRYDIPLTTVAHGTLLNKFDEHPTSVQNAIRAVLRSSDRVFCVSEALEAKASQIVMQAKTQHLPLGATPSNFPITRSEQLRREFNLPSDSIVVLYCGHFTEAKGVHDLIEILPEMTDERLYFVFIGHGGGLRWDIQHALNRSRVSGRVLWKMHPVVVRRWFALADLFVLPSYSEGRPTVIYEAMASSTAVAASNVGGIPEQVLDGETGWLFDSGDRETLVELLNSLDYEKLQTVGARGLDHLRENGWTWKSHAQKLIETHKQLI